MDDLANIRHEMLGTWWIRESVTDPGWFWASDTSIKAAPAHLFWTKKDAYVWVLSQIPWPDENAH